VGLLPGRRVARDLGVPFRVVPPELGLRDRADSTDEIEPAVREEKAEPNAAEQEVRERDDALGARGMTELAPERDRAVDVLATRAVGSDVGDLCAEAPEEA